jgi:hypothetical protein
VVTQPESETARVFTALAERLDVELTPRRVFHPELKIN